MDENSLVYHLLHDNVAKKISAFIGSIVSVFSPGDVVTKIFIGTVTGVLVWCITRTIYWVVTKVKNRFSL